MYRWPMHVAILDASFDATVPAVSPIPRSRSTSARIGDLTAGWLQGGTCQIDRTAHRFVSRRRSA
jgi:hypothetical protein